MMMRLMRGMLSLWEVMLVVIKIFFLLDLNLFKFVNWRFWVIWLCNGMVGKLRWWRIMDNCWELVMVWVKMIMEDEESLLVR